MGGVESVPEDLSRIWNGVHSAGVLSDEAWREFKQLPDVHADLWVMLHWDTVQKLPSHTLATLLRKVIHVLSTVIFLPSSTLLTPDLIALTVNCVSVLTRIMPVVLCSAKLRRFLWKGSFGGGSDDTPAPPVIVDPENQRSDARVLFDECPPAQQLARLLTNALFLPDFTIRRPPHSQDAMRGGVYTGKLWESCIGPKASFVQPADAEFDRHKTIVLKALLACCCEDALLSGESLSKRHRFVQLLCDTKTCPLAKTLSFSLANTVLNYNPVSSIPYMHLLHQDHRQPLVQTSLHVLLALLDYRLLPSDTDLVPANVVNVIYGAFFQTLDRSDVERVLEHLLRLLQCTVDAHNTMLPSSSKEVAFFEELFVLLWKWLDESVLMPECVASRAPDVVSCLVFFMWRFRSDPLRIGLIHTCAFTLLKLSGDREFCVALNQPYDERIPADIPSFQGSFADLLIICAHKLIVNSSHHVDSLFHVLLTILSNVSPYVTSICLYSSVKLLNLFQVFSSPKFLFAAETHAEYLSFLLEMFNNLVQYQWGGSAQLVYALTRRDKLFYELGMLEVSPRQEEDDQEHKESEEDQEWHATQEWLSQWKRRFPLETIFRLLEYLVPRLELFCSKAPVEETTVIRWIQHTTLVGILPVPHSIVIRRYRPSLYTCMWFTTYFWGLVFLRSEQRGLPLFPRANVKMLRRDRSPSPLHAHSHTHSADVLTQPPSPQNRSQSEERDLEEASRVVQEKIAPLVQKY